MAQETATNSSAQSGQRNSTDAQSAPALESAGVEDLIARLRDQGITEGRTQADALVSEAQKQAAEIVAAARQEADAILVKAGEDAAKLKAAGEDAVRLATRDTMLAIESDLISRFQNMLHRLVKGALDDPEFLQRLILEVAGQTSPAASAGRAEVLLPSEVISWEDLRKTPEQARPGTLMHFVLSLGGGLLREGVSFGSTDDIEAGIRVKLTGEDMQIDLTSSSLEALLLRHMLPRFRALLRGAVVLEKAGSKQIESAGGGAAE